MNVQIRAIDWQLLGIVWLALFLFGLTYNGFMTAMGQRKEGYTALYVALGVMATLGGAAILDWQAALLSLVMFIASGTPMIAGDMWRHMRRREEAERNAREQALTEIGNG